MFTDETDIWESLHYGEKKSEDLEMKLPNYYNDKRYSRRVGDAVNKIFILNRVGCNTSSFWVGDTNIVSVIGDNNNPDCVTHIEGLKGPDEENPTKSHSWQIGLRPVLDYFIGKDDEILSIYNLLKNVTNKEVKIYCYSKEFSHCSAQVALINKANGSKGYAVFLNEPKTLVDIISLLHEIGHIQDMETSQLSYEEEFAILMQDPDCIAAVKETDDILDSIDEPTDEDIEKVDKKFYSSLGFRKIQSYKMQFEARAWSHAVDIINGNSLLRGIIKTSSKSFINDVIWSIKTRLPKHYLQEK